MMRKVYLYIVFFTFLICACSEDASTYKNRALGNMKWGIDKSEYSSVSTQWLSIISPRNIPMYGDILLENNPLKAGFDQEGKLSKLNLYFKPFYINNNDSIEYYRTKEMERNGKKIEHLIDIISTIYGSPKILYYNANDYDKYFKNATCSIAQWETEGTITKLISDNVCDGKSCCFKLRLMTEKR